MKKQIRVTKMDGTVQPYKEGHLITSLTRSGASRAVAKGIADHIRRELYDLIPTTKIYQHAHELLERQSSPAATFRYSLRRAVAELGPSGFPFERFVGELFRLQGYKVEVGKKLRGKCVSHEVDVIGRKENEVLTAELKFHNKLTIKTDLKVALYVRARFDDLAAAGFYDKKNQRVCVVTNTKFSSGAIRYAACAGIELIGWNFPKSGQGNLHDLIQTSGIHPLTCLSSLSKKQKQHFLEQKMVLCSDLAANNYQALKDAKGIVPKGKIQKIREEIEMVCECVGPDCKK